LPFPELAGQVDRADNVESAGDAREDALLSCQRPCHSASLFFIHRAGFVERVICKQRRHGSSGYALDMVRTRHTGSQYGRGSRVQSDGADRAVLA
jgi:hypothetical protein